MKINVVPVPKPRMTQSDKWKKRPCVLRYRAFKDALRAAGLTTLDEELFVDFYLPMPESWNERKRARMRGEVHQQKPDLSNLIKALEDAVLTDDSKIFHIHAAKYWADTGCIHIE